jgi:tetratricopeptide (TPR) repeat protein
MFRRKFIAALTSLLLAVMCGMHAAGQQMPLNTNRPDSGRSGTADDGKQEAERELQLGIGLTSRGHFQQAIPHLKLADGVALETFAVEFNLGLCYLGTRQFQQAIQTLTGIRGSKQQMSDVKNLLAQAYISDRQQEKGRQAFQEAAALTPDNEKLYAFVSDACLDEGFYTLGIEVTNIGLHNLRNSARLYLQRGLLRSRLEEIALADQDFQRASELAPDSDIGYIAAVQQALSSGNIEEAIKQARDAIRGGHSHYMLLTMLGEALLRAGATVATPVDLGEAQAALEKAVSERPGYSSAQISLGKVYLMQRRLEQAIEHFELGRQLDPNNPAVYSNLAIAYRRNGESDKVREMLAMLAELNWREAARVGSANGGHNGIAAGPAVQ